MRPLVPDSRSGKEENKQLNSQKPDRRPPNETIEEHWRRASLAVKWRSIPGNVRGGIWMLIAALFFSIMVALIKFAGQTLHVTEILLVRQVTMLIITAPMIVSAFPRSLHSERPGLQVLRIVVAFFSMVLGFTAIINLPLAEATAISFGKTFFATILAIVILGEIVGPRRWGAVIAGFVGVLIVAWPSGEGAFNIYGLLAIISAGCVACVMIIVRKLSQVDMPITILSYQAIGVGLLMVPPAIWYWSSPTFNEWLLLIAIGAFSVLGQYCNILGLRAAEASAVAPLDYARLVYAILLGLWMFGEWPEPRVFAGAALIIAAAAYTLHRERIRGREKAKARASAQH
jgi:drug/metabolite transporter (DMT)-like permease